MACKQVEDGDHDSKLVLTGSGSTFLYQAYLGRVEVSANNAFDVFVDDSAIQTGTTGTLIGNTARTWYDGISYASVNTVTSVSENKEHPVEFSLSQNHPNPFNPVTVIGYQLSAVGRVELKVFDLLGREIATLVNKEQNAGKYEVEFDASNLPSGTYFYKLRAADYVEVKKMMVLR